MAGREKEPVYVYTEKGKFIKKYESQKEVCDNYNLTKGRFYEVIGFRKLPDNNYAFSSRIGREEVKRKTKIYNDKFCNKLYITSKPIEVINLLGEKIAEFRSPQILHLLTGKNIFTSLTRVNRKNGLKSKNYDNFDNLTFKYKHINS